MAALPEDPGLAQAALLAPTWDSQPAVIPVLGDSMLPSGFQGHQVHTWYTDTHEDKTPIHIKNTYYIK